MMISYLSQSNMTDEAYQIWIGFVVGPTVRTRQSDLER